MGEHLPASVRAGPSIEGAERRNLGRWNRWMGPSHVSEKTPDFIDRF